MKPRRPNLHPLTVLAVLWTVTFAVFLVIAALSAHEEGRPCRSSAPPAAQVCGP